MTPYAKIKALNWSGLSPMAVSARQCLWYQDHERDDSAAMLIGRVVHCLVLEPTEAVGRYLVPEQQQCEATTKAGKRCSKSSVPGDVLCSIHGGACTDEREVVTPEQWRTASLVADAIYANPDAVALLDGTERERVCQWTMHRIACKARLDAVKPSAVIDVKTCRSLLSFARKVERPGCSVWAEARDAATRLYYGQAAWYRDGAVAAGLCEDPESFIIAVETAPPYDSAVFRLPPVVIDAGRRLYERLLDQWVVCRRDGQWPGQYQGVTDMLLPRWADGQEDEGF